MVEVIVMKLLFLNPPFGYKRPEGLDAPMGIMYLSAVLKQHGHTCNLVDHAWEDKDDWSKWDIALKEKPEVVLVNTQIRYSDETHEAIRRIRSRHASIPAVAFGPQASTEAPRLLMEMGVDACVIGEPEEIVPQVLSEYNQTSETMKKTETENGAPITFKAFPGIATRDFPEPDTAPRVDIEALPFPDWDLVDYGRYIQTTRNAVFLSSRGYELEDTFSQPPLIYATRPTRRCSVDRVVDELTELRRRFSGRYMILFHDEVFTEDREWVIRLCSRLRQANLDVPYWCFTRPDLVDTHLCRIMRMAGFVGLSMGMESASDRILDILERGYTLSQIEDGFRAAQKAGLLTVGSVMIGTPGRTPGTPDETWEEIESTANMVGRLHPDVLTVTFTTPLPGTTLHEIGADRILATSQEDYNYYHVWPGKYPLRLDLLTPEDLTAGLGLIRRTWKGGLWKTAWRISSLGLLNGAFRNTLFSHAVKVICRKILPGA